MSGGRCDEGEGGRNGGGVVDFGTEDRMGILEVVEGSFEK